MQRYATPPTISRCPACLAALRHRRNSKWANSALVVTVQPGDWEHLQAEHGPLAGMALQQEVRGWVGGKGCEGNLTTCVRQV